MGGMKEFAHLTRPELAKFAEEMRHQRDLAHRELNRWHMQALAARDKRDQQKIRAAKKRASERASKRLMRVLAASNAPLFH